MPISLPPIDRRRFLGSVLSGALLSLPDTAAFGREAAATDIDTWALLSDTHIPADRNFIYRDVNPVEHFSRIRTDVLSGAAGKPGGVIVCGDCAHVKELPNDYVTLLEEFEPFRRAELPIHFVMGNHDNRRKFLDTVARSEGRKEPETVPDRLHSILETPKADIFLLDSLERTNQSSGLFGKSQLDWLADELDARKGKPAILVAHHYPDYTAGFVSNPHALRDTAAFFDVIKERKQVKAYLFGHAHLWKTLRRNGIHLVNIPATAWRFDPAQPYAWVLMRLDFDGASLTLRSLDPNHPKHDETIRLDWR